MKSVEEFKRYYETTMFPELQGLELLRLKVIDEVKGFKVKLLVVGLIILPLSFILLNHFFPSILGHLICFYPMIILSLFIMPSVYKTYRMKESGFLNDFKQKVIRKMVCFFDESFSYVPEGHVSMDDFKRANLFPKTQTANRIKGDDLITGKIGEVEIMFSELHVDYHSGSGKNSHTDPIFNGLFFAGEFNRKFRPTETGLVSQGTANYESFQNRMESFKIKGNVYHSCTGSKMFIAITTGELFEPKIDRTLLNFEELTEYVEYLRFAIGTFEDIIKEKSMWMEEDRGKLEQTPDRPAVEAGQRTCPSCGTKISGELRFCTNCGSPL
jgi:hypothetical protein